MKFLIFLVLAYFGYRLLKSWAKKYLGLHIHTTSGRNSEIDDVMVKDPFCQVYFPKRQGIHLFIKGEDLYFCSQNCRDRFLEHLSKQ